MSGILQKRRRAHWTPTNTSVICSSHFKHVDYERRFTNLPGFGRMKEYLKEGEICVVPVPSIHPVVEEEEGGGCFKDYQSHKKLLQPAPETDTSVTLEVDTAAEAISESDQAVQCDEQLFKNAVCQAEMYCPSCNILTKQNRRLQNQQTKASVKQNMKRARPDEQSKHAFRHLIAEAYGDSISTQCSQKIKGLTDCWSSDEMNRYSDSARHSWIPLHPKGEAFAEYFETHKLPWIKNTMSVRIRSAAGQQTDVLVAMFGDGEYRVDDASTMLAVNGDEYYVMSSKEGQQKLKMFNSAPVVHHAPDQSFQ
eukprot:gene21279-23350_t